MECLNVSNKGKNNKIMAKSGAANKSQWGFMLGFLVTKFIPSSTFNTQKQYSTAGGTVLSCLHPIQNNTNITLKCNVLALMTLYLTFSFHLTSGPFPHHTDAPRRVWQTLITPSSEAGSGKVFAAPKLQTCTKNYICL